MGNNSDHGEVCVCVCKGEGGREGGALHILALMVLTWVGSSSGRGEGGEVGGFTTYFWHLIWVGSSSGHGKGGE